jgi:uncharacterized protein YndB with AHSA1/START domain
LINCSLADRQTNERKPMTNPLTLETEGDTHVVVKRRFLAAPEQVFAAHTDPAIIKQWMLGPEGWTMPVCICEAEPGGAIRYEWSDGAGGGFFLTGNFIELDPPRRIVHVERMHLPDPTPDNRIETTFTAEGSNTLMLMKMTLPDAATREAMLATGMEKGMEVSYARLEQLWQNLPGSQ